MRYLLLMVLSTGCTTTPPPGVPKCPNAIINHMTVRPWSKIDTMTFNAAKKHCKKNKSYPCLTVFNRKGNYHFNGYCGSKT